MPETPVAERIAAAADAAVACEVATHCPAELSMAQWALESGWGAHSPGNNCFGIKAYSGCYGVQSLITNEFYNGAMHREPRAFATFEHLSDCFIKHAQLITGGLPYRDAWAKYKENANVEQLIYGIAHIYATAPNYASILLGLIAQKNIKDALAAAWEREHAKAPIHA
jgi:flagellum-specific peptidoglycan hydrolase FlgJ